jgi:hypothetical protein
MTEITPGGRMNGGQTAVAPAHRPNAAVPPQSSAAIGDRGAEGASFDVVDALQSLSAKEFDAPPPTIADSLYALIRPQGVNPALLQPSRLMTLLDAAIGALDPVGFSETQHPASIDLESMGIAALREELSHQRSVAHRRAGHDSE